MSECTPKCGDNVIVDSECDDGNLDSLDGCSNTCVFEDGWNCDSSSGKTVCQAICGDGKVVKGETCDD